MSLESRIRRLERYQRKSDSRLYVVTKVDGGYSIDDKILTDGEFENWKATLSDDDVLFLVTCIEA